MSKRKSKKRQLRKELKQFASQYRQWWQSSRIENQQLQKRIVELETDVDYHKHYHETYHQDAMNERKKITDLEHELEAANIVIEAIRDNLSPMYEGLGELLIGRIDDWLNTQGETFSTWNGGHTDVAYDTEKADNRWVDQYANAVTVCGGKYTHRGVEYKTLAEAHAKAMDDVRVPVSRVVEVENEDAPYGHDFNRDNMRVFPDGTVEYAGHIFSSLTAAYKAKDEAENE